jgi:hypothetical protein
MMHHPLLAAGLAWWALLSLTVRLDFGSLIVGVLPTVAVVIQYLLAKKQRQEIARESAEKVAEVHTLVNSQHAELKADLTAKDVRIDALSDKLAASTPGPA